MNDDLCWIAKKLEKYCTENHKDFVSFIGEHHLFFLPQDVNRKQAIKHTAIRKNQYYRNMATIQCMAELKTICQESNIQYVFMKGLPLADELYSPRENRIYSDIDILISKENLLAFMRKLDCNGFTGDDGIPVCDERVFRKVKTGHHHLNSISKKYVVGETNVEVIIEVHISPNECGYEFFGETNKDLSFTDVVLTRARTYQIDQVQICIPSLTDALYTMLLHMVMHICLDIILYLYTKKPFKYVPVVQKTIDIALYIRKHKERINWPQLFDTANKYGTQPLITYAFSMLTELYGDELTPFSITMDSHCKNNPCNDICRIMEEIAPSEYIFRSFFKEHLDIIVKRNAQARGDIILPDVIVQRNAGNMKIQILCTDIACMYCINIYNTDVSSSEISREYIIAISREGVDVFTDSPYNEDIFANYSEKELAIYYIPAQVEVIRDNGLICLELQSEDIGFDFRNATIVVEKNDKFNPFRTKKFI